MLKHAGGIEPPEEFMFDNKLDLYIGIVVGIVVRTVIGECTLRTVHF
jgi:hypothetical protein